MSSLILRYLLLNILYLPNQNIYKPTNHHSCFPFCAALLSPNPNPAATTTNPTAHPHFPATTANPTTIALPAHPIAPSSPRHTSFPSLETIPHTPFPT